MVDQGLFQLEGMVPWGTNNTYKMPVNVYAFGPPDPAHATMVKHRLLRAGLQLGSWGDHPKASQNPHCVCLASCTPDHLQEVIQQWRYGGACLGQDSSLGTEGRHPNHSRAPVNKRR